MSSSPPETPRNKDPTSESKWRFHVNGTPCEWGESYHPGSYHPVHIQDVFHSRYRVIRKLGYGSFSTVWLAIDLRSSCYVALKILTAKSHQQSAVSSDFLVHDRLVANDAHSQHIVRLLDSFNHHGPNGVHLCLVYEALGPNLNSMLSLSPQCQIGEHWERRLPKEWARRILRDALLGLQFLHANGIIHGDVHPGNILFTIKLPSPESDPPESLQQCPDEDNLLERLDGKADRWAPGYLLEPRSLYDYTSLDLNPLVKISDFGAAFLEGPPPSTLVTPAALRAPEVVLGDRFAAGLDIWSLGCLIFELITGHPLFNVESLEGNQFDEQTNDEHLIQITETIQPLPEVLFNKWHRAHMYYGPDGERLDTCNGGNSSHAGSTRERLNTNGSPNEMGEENQFDHESDNESQGLVSLASLRDYDSLEKRFRDVKPADIDEREEEEIVQLIRMALQPNAAARASADQLLQQRWFENDGRTTHMLGSVVAEGTLL